MRVTNSSRVRFLGNNEIENFQFGLLISNISNVDFHGPGTGPPAIIRGNKVLGVGVFNLSRVRLGVGVTITNNGGVGPNEPSASLASGVFGGRGSVLNIGGAKITGNLAPGVLANPTTTVALAGSTITDNSREGVRLLHQSVAESVGGNTISGNGIADLSCDQTSLAFGDLTGIGVIRCGIQRRP